jgi:hypothetical protein
MGRMMDNPFMIIDVAFFLTLPFFQRREMLFVPAVIITTRKNILSIDCKSHGKSSTSVDDVIVIIITIIISLANCEKGFRFSYKDLWFTADYIFCKFSFVMGHLYVSWIVEILGRTLKGSYIKRVVH